MFSVPPGFAVGLSHVPGTPCLSLKVSKQRGPSDETASHSGCGTIKVGQDKDDPNLNP